MQYGNAQPRVAEDQLADGEDRWQPGHVVHRALPGAVEDLLGQVDVGDLVALGASAVVVAGVVAQIDVVGQGLGEGQPGEEADQQRRLPRDFRRHFWLN